MTEKKIRILSCILSFVLGVGIGVGGYGISQIFDKESERTVYTEKGDMVCEKTTENGISLLSTTIAAEDYEENGISPQAENAYTVTAKAIPEDATLTNLTWSLAWSNDSYWANNNNISDYLTISPSAQSCTVTCIKGGFLTPAVLTATLNSDSSKKATVQIDYLRRPTSLNFYTSHTGSGDLYKGGLNIGKSTSFICLPETGVDGTVDGTFDITSMTLTFSDMYVWSAVRNNRYFKAGLTKLGMSSSAFVPKSSIPLTIDSYNSFTLSNLWSLYNINGNGAFSSYVQNALYEVLSSFTGTQNCARITVKGTYSKGDVSMSLQDDYELNHFDLSSVTVPTVTL